MKKLLPILLAGLIAVSGATALSSQPASAAGRNPLDIDVRGWCKAKYGGAAKYDDFNNPYSWYCEY